MLTSSVTEVSPELDRESEQMILLLLYFHDLRNLS